MAHDRDAYADFSEDAVGIKYAAVTFRPGGPSRLIYCQPVLVYLFLRFHPGARFAQGAGCRPSRKR